MTSTLENILNGITNPPVLFTLVVLAFLLVFPPTERLKVLHRRLGLHYLWTWGGCVAIFVVLTGVLLFGLQNPNFHALILKPDNVPIVGMLYLMPFFLWLSMHQAVTNDARLAEGGKPMEWNEPEDRVLVWPDLVYIELIAAVLITVLLIVWSIGVPAPLEAPANPTVSPNPSKAPWYFLGLQELLVYFDPWIAGVMLPTVMVLALMAIPYIDVNPKGQGYYSFDQRRMAIFLFLFCWFVLWLFLIFIGTFLRGPNWGFFGPFEAWDPHRLVSQTNINLSEYVYSIFLRRPLPEQPLLREIVGITTLCVYFLFLPALLARTKLREFYNSLGAFRYTVFLTITLVMMGLPIKMYLRWLINLKYIITLPEINLNI